MHMKKLVFLLIFSLLMPQYSVFAATSQESNPPTLPNTSTDLFDLIKQPFSSDKNTPLSLKIMTKNNSYAEQGRITEQFYISVNKAISSLALSIFNQKTHEKIVELKRSNFGIASSIPLPEGNSGSPWHHTLLPTQTYEYTATATGVVPRESAIITGTFTTANTPVRRGPIELTVTSTKNPIALGDSFELSWNAPNADRCDSSGFDPLGGWAQKIPTNGSQKLNVPVDEKRDSKFYQIHCSNFTYETTAYIDIPIIHDSSAPMPVVSFSASDADIKDGENITLSWNVNNHEDCLTSVDYFNEESGTWKMVLEAPWSESLTSKIPQKKGSMKVSPPMTAQYTLICYNKHNLVHKGITVIVDDVEPLTQDPYSNFIGKTRIEMRNIDPEAPTPHILLEANPVVIQEGSPVKISWNVDAADTCRLSSRGLPSISAQKADKQILRKISRNNLSEINGYLDRINELDSKPEPTFGGVDGRNSIFDLQDELDAYFYFGKGDAYYVPVLQKDSVNIKGSQTSRPKTTSFYELSCTSGYKTVGKTIVVIVEPVKKKVSKRKVTLKKKK